MSKKLGGARLRFVSGLTALLATFGVVLAFNAPRFASASFIVNELNGGTTAAFSLSGLNDETIYYLVPVNLESNPSLTGWGHDDEQTGAGTLGNPYVFIEGSPAAIRINGEGDPIQTVDGAKTVYLKTLDPGETLGDQDSSVEVRSSAVNGSVVAEDEITILTQE